MSEKQKCTCPLCGKKTISIKEFNWGRPVTFFECTDKKACGFVFYIGLPEAEARARFMQRPVSIETKLIEVLKEYNKLLCDELNDLGGLRISHGWVSPRIQAGIDVRAKIEQIEKELKDV
jgi:hypothetical protein